MNRRQWLTMFASAMAVLRWPRHADAQRRAVRPRGEVGVRRVCGDAGLEGTDRLARRAGRAVGGQRDTVSRRGQTPLAGALVFAYHTDRHGLYNPNQATHSWRLRGAVRTAADGSFEFQTIRPPRTRRRASRSTFMWHADGRRQLPRRRMAFCRRPHGGPGACRVRARGEFGWVRPVSVGDAVHTIDVKVRVNPDRAFS